MTPSPSVTMTPSATPTRTATLTATATVTSTATVTATATDAVTPTATVTTTSGATPTITATSLATATATATSIATPTASATATPTAVATTTLSAAPAELNFGKVDATGISHARKITLINRGKVAAAIANVLVNGPFSIANGSDTCTGQTIAPKKKCSFEMVFLPPTPTSAQSGSIDVVYNGARPTISMSGNGIAVALKSLRSKSFGNVIVGQNSKPASILISNPSVVTVSLGTATIGGTNASSFAINGDQCSMTALAARAKCGIGVRFAPSNGASGTQSATLSLGFTYGANNGSVAIGLSGKVK